MLADTFQCPQCQAKLNYTSTLLPGTVVRCPQCQNTFPIPDPEAAAAEPPQPLPPAPVPRDEVTTELGAGPRPTRVTDEPYEPRDRDRRYPDDDDYPRPPRDDYRDRGPDVPLSNRYEMDIGKWFNIAFAHYGTILGPIIGFLFILAGIEVVVYIVSIFLILATGIPFAHVPVVLLNAIVIVPPFQAGMMLVCLKQLDGRPWTFGDFFSGFQGRFLGKVIVLNLIPFGIVLLVELPLIAGVVMLNLNGSEALGFGLLGVSGLLAIVAIYFQVRLFFYALPLVLDRNYGPIEALKGSWTLTEGHFWGTFGASLLIGLIAAVGIFACYIGALFTIPIAMLIYAACYLDVAGIDPPLPRPDSRSQWRENG